MKISKAEKLICPFIKAVDRGGWSRDNGEPSYVNCITNKCMAWKMTKTKNYDRQFIKCDCGYNYEYPHYDRCPKCGDILEKEDLEDLPREQCNGYCRRITND